MVDHHKSSSPPTSLSTEPTLTPLSQIPALVVSGFLGAGKTALVRNLLEDAQRRGLRLAVVSNEFGALGIDQALLGSENQDGYVELEGGCVCCKLSDELVQTLQGLWERMRPDRVIVETSGVALPFDTLLNFWREPVSQWVGESIAVVVVNAEQMAEGRDIEGTFEQQVGSADLLLLNKTDLIEAVQIKTIESQLERMAPGTPVVHTINANVPTEVLFPPDPQALSKRRERRQEVPPHSHEAFESEVIVIEQGIHPKALLQRIQSFQSLRAKGFVHTSQGIRLLQGVGPRLDLIEPSVPPPSHLIGRIVVIRRSQGSPITH